MTELGLSKGPPTLHQVNTFFRIVTQQSGGFLKWGYPQIIHSSECLTRFHAVVSSHQLQERNLETQAASCFGASCAAFFEELNMMMESFRACLAAMFWSLVLLIFMVFVRHWAVTRVVFLQFSS